MELAELAGRSYGPVTLEISAAKVAEYVDATSDEPGRWGTHAPPSYAGALLFVMAPRFLFSDDVRAYTRVLVHSDQRFAWHGPIAVGDEVAVAAEVARVRVRAPLHFVTFTASVDGAGGRLIDSESTFLMAAEGEPDPGPEVGEPPVSEAGPCSVASPIQHAGAGSMLPSLAKSASRADLVRYAGASGDFNPIHFDHDAARAAGFEGVVVHGLLMGAWASQIAAATSRRPDPLAELRLRFRNPLRPAAAATVSGQVASVDDETAALELSVTAGDTELVTGRATVRNG